MAREKGQCKLFAQSQDNFTKDLTIGQIFDFEKEFVEALGGFGYYIVLGPEKVQKIKEDSFKLYFKEKPVNAKPAEVAQGPGNESKATAEKANQFSGPKKEEAVKEEPAIKPSQGTSVLSEWKRYEHLINSIMLKPFDGKSGMVSVIVNVKPDIDLTMTAPAENVFNSILPSLAKLETLEGKIKDLTSIIEERIALENKKKEDAKKATESKDDKGGKATNTKAEKGKTTTTKPAATETKQETATLFDNKDGDASEKAEEENWETDKKDDNGAAGGNDVDNW